jgi:hypothetical protein
MGDKQDAVAVSRARQVPPPKGVGSECCCVHHSFVVLATDQSLRSEGLPESHRHTLAATFGTLHSLT